MKRRINFFIMHSMEVKDEKIIGFVFLLGVLALSCMPRVAVKDSLFFSDKEKVTFLKDECNPLLGALVNKSDDEANIQIYKKENSSYKLITEVILRPRLKNNAVCEEGSPMYLKYFLLPDYGIYVLSMIVVYKEIVEDQEVTFVNKKNTKFEITKDSKCDKDLKIGWYFEIIN